MILLVKSLSLLETTARVTLPFNLVSISLIPSYGLV